MINSHVVYASIVASINTSIYMNVVTGFAFIIIDTNNDYYFCENM